MDFLLARPSHTRTFTRTQLTAGFDNNLEVCSEIACGKDAPLRLLLDGKEIRPWRDPKKTKNQEIIPNKRDNSAYVSEYGKACIVGSGHRTLGKRPAAAVARASQIPRKPDC
jgi:hypothetical protein